MRRSLGARRWRSPSPRRPRAQDTIVVTQWDQFAQSGITAAGPAMDELIATCEPALNGAEVLRTIAPSIGIRDSYRLAVSAGKTPDLAYTWPAASVLAGYARVGALAPLDDYYAQVRLGPGQRVLQGPQLLRGPDLRACRWSRT